MFITDKARLEDKDFMWGNGLAFLILELNVKLTLNPTPELAHLQYG